MIDYMDRLLKHWAQEMNVKGDGHGLGFRSRSTWVEIGAALESGLDVAESCADGYVSARGSASRPGRKLQGMGKVAQRIQAAVDELDVQLQRVIEVYYREIDLSATQKAKILGCSGKTMYKHIHRAHLQISATLPDSYANWKATYPPCG